MYTSFFITLSFQLQRSLSGGECEGVKSGDGASGEGEVVMEEWQFSTLSQLKQVSHNCFFDLTYLLHNYNDTCTYIQLILICISLSLF